MICTRRYSDMHRTVLAALAVFLLLVPWDVFASAGVDEGTRFEDRFFSEKERGAYFEALATLVEWTEREENHILIETNIFRLEELASQTELIDPLLEACDAIDFKNPQIRRNWSLRHRLRLLKAALLVRRARIHEASRLREELGFVNRLHVLGPFRNSDPSDFESARLPGEGFDPGREYQARLHPVRWHEMEADCAGSFDMGERGAEARDSLFFLRAAVAIEREGSYTLFLGKTGYTELFLDGASVFKNMTRHGFGADQYRIEVRLDRGLHEVLIKLGDSRGEGIRCALRILDAAGRGAGSASPGLSIGGTKPSLVSVGLFPSLAQLIDKRGTSPRDDFLKAYLFHASGLSSEENREAAHFLQRAVRDKKLAPRSSYLLGVVERDSEVRERHFSDSLRLNPLSVEALEQIARIKLNNGFVYEAYPLVGRMKAINPSSALGGVLEAECFIAKGWYTEAMKAAEALMRSRYPVTGRSVKAYVYSLQQRYADAAREYEALVRADRSNRTWLLNLSHCHVRRSDLARAAAVLEEAIPVFPADIALRHRLAQLVRSTYGTERSIPYLSSAMSIYPYDARVLYELGTAYQGIGKRKLAAHYLRRTLSADPKNFKARQYLDLIEGGRDEIREYLFSNDPSVLAKKAEAHAEEPVVQLLDECAYRVFLDGSYERWVRRIYRINEASGIDDLSRQYIIYNPSTDRLEEASCTVINNGTRIDVPEYHTQSLSDPESRLYYDLKARIYTLPSLRRGSIVDFRFRLKSAEGDINRGYFGERVLLGGGRRILVSNVLVSFPDDKEIYCHVRRLARSAVRLLQKGRMRVYRITLNDIPPYRKERYMPSLPEVAPFVVFTSMRDWDSLYRWYAALVRDRMRSSGEMKSKVRELVREGDDERAVIKKIFDHVSGAVRYVGFEFGIGGVQPRPADLTYRTGMGDCKDMSLVLAAMLREAGLDARIALVRTRSNGILDRSIPFLGQFNHALCFSGGKSRIFLDATVKMSGHDELPSEVRDIEVFLLDETGFNFVNTGGSSYSRNIDSAVTSVSVRDDGSAVLARTITKGGDFAPRARFDLLNAESKLRSIAEYWSTSHPGSRVHNLRVQNAGTNFPVRYSYELELPSIMSRAGEYMFFKPFLVASDFYRDYGMKRERRFPIVVQGRYSSESRLEFQLPEGLEILRLPEAETFTHKKFEASFRYARTDKNGIVVSSVVRFKDYSIGVDEYPSFREFTRFILRKENERITLKKNTGGGLKR